MSAEWKSHDTRRGRFRARVDPRFEDPAEEARFRREIALESLPQLRFGLLIGIPIWVAVGVFVPYIVPIDQNLIGVITTMMIALDVAVLLLVRGQPSLARIQWLGIVSSIANASAVIVLTVASGSLTRFTTPGLILTLVYAFSVLRLRLVAGLFVAGVIVIVYVAIVLTQPSPGDFAVDTVLIVGAMMIGAVASYRLERSSRELFEQRRVISGQAAEIAVEKEKSDRLLRAVLPEKIAARLRDDPVSLAEGFEEATVLFSDLVGFTPLAAALSPAATVRLLNDLVSRFDALTADCGLEKIKTIGDAYMAVGGVPDPLDDHAGRAVELGLRMVRAVEVHGRETGLPLYLRVGVHTGPVVAGIIGTTRFSYDLWGDTVNIASRMESQGVAGCVQITEATAERLGDRYSIEQRGTVEVKGRGPMQAFLVRGPAQPSPGS